MSRDHFPPLYDSGRSVGAALDSLVDPATGTIPMDILWVANPISLINNERGRVLLQAMERPRYLSENSVLAPLALGGKRTLSSIEYYDKLLETDEYSYGKDHLYMFSQYARLIGRYLKDANLVEPCMGSGHNTAFGLTQMSERPFRILAVDIDPVNHRLYRNTVGQVPHPVEHMVDITGDWLAEGTYKRKKTVEYTLDISEDRSPEDIYLRKKNRAKGWDYYQGDVLEALRNDPRPTVILLQNTASNFDLDKQLRFIRKNFKPDTIVILSYDNTRAVPALKTIYSPIIISQWIVASVAYKLWHSTYPNFDPRKIGGRVTAKEEGSGTTISFKVFEKDDPENTTREFSPLSRMSNLDFRKHIYEGGLEVLDRLPMFPHDRPNKYDNGLWILRVLEGATPPALSR
jgi:hypothetical protein